MYSDCKVIQGAPHRAGFRTNDAAAYAKRSLSMKMRVLPAPQRGPRPCRRLLQIRCAGTAYGDFRTKSVAQAPHLPTFASMSLQIRCTGTAYGDIRTKSVAQVLHLLTVASMSLRIRCTKSAAQERIC